MCSSDSEDDVLIHKKRQNKVDPLSSPHPQAVRELLPQATFTLQANPIPIKSVFFFLSDCPQCLTSVQIISGSLQTGTHS